MHYHSSMMHLHGFCKVVTSGDRATQDDDAMHLHGFCKVVTYVSSVRLAALPWTRQDLVWSLCPTSTNT